MLDNDHPLNREVGYGLTKSKPEMVPANQLHLHYTAGQLERALIQIKIGRLDKRMDDLKKEALRLQKEYESTPE